MGPHPTLLLGWTAGGGAGALDHVRRIDDRRGPPLAGLEADDDVLVELGLAPAGDCVTVTFIA